MQDRTAIQQPLSCPRCHTAIVCQPGNIGHCHCNDVTITKQEYDYINARYSACLCNSCIGVLQQEYHATKNILRHER